MVAIKRAIEPYERKKAEDIVKAAEQEPEIIDILECFVTFDMQNSIGNHPECNPLKDDHHQ